MRTRDIVAIALLAACACTAYAERSVFSGAVRYIRQEVAPCSQPITYSIGSIDPRFDIATSTLVADLADAESIWEAASGRNLFTYEPAGGAVTVNLVYDERQAATDRLQSLGYSIDTSQATYDTLKADYDSLHGTVQSERAAYESAAATYRSDEASYNQQVEEWNARGGAPQSVYDTLQTKKDALDQEYQRVQSLEQTVNSHIDTENALATELNQLIVQLNLNVDQYNQTGAARGEFEEGVYEESGGVQTIDIYEYTGHTKLVRVLAHELGHALGLQHVMDPAAIMYRLNSGTALKATSADIQELDLVCRIQS